MSRRLIVLLFLLAGALGFLGAGLLFFASSEDAVKLTAMESLEVELRGPEGAPLTYYVACGDAMRLCADVKKAVDVPEGDPVCAAIPNDFADVKLTYPEGESQTYELSAPCAPTEDQYYALVEALERASLPTS